MEKTIPEHYLVAYLDILGFSQAIIDSEKELKYLTKNSPLISLLENIQHEVQQSNNISEVSSDTHQKTGRKKPVQMLAVSDSIIIICQDIFNIDEIYVEHFYGKINHIIRECMENDFLIRGGVSMGQHLYYDGVTIAGKVYQDAVCLEKKANNPRILIDIKIIKHNEERIKPPNFIQDKKDGQYSLNYFYQSEKDELDDAQIFIKKTLQLLKTKIKKGYSRKKKQHITKIIKKYKWLEKELERNIKSSSTQQDD